MGCVTCSSSGRLEFSSHDQANIVPLSVDYNDVYISHAIENNLHKQQCIIGLINPLTRRLFRFHASFKRIFKGPSKGLV